MTNVQKKIERVRAIIIVEDNILLIHRVMEKEVSYWVVPGGGVELGENHEQAVKRECMEELGITVDVNTLFMQRTLDKIGSKGQEEFFYLCKITGCEVGTGKGPEFDPGTKIYKGEHKVSWVDLKELAGIDLRPHEVRDKIIKEFLAV